MIDKIERTTQPTRSVNETRFVIPGRVIRSGKKEVHADKSRADRNFQELNRVTNKIALQCINPADINVAGVIQDSLHDIAGFIGADRGYIYFNTTRKEITGNKYEWCAPGLDKGQPIPSHLITKWMEMHRQGKPVSAPKVSALASPDLRDFLVAQGIKSLITVPLIDGAEYLGFIGFDSIERHHNYTAEEQKLLFLFAQLLINLEQRQRAGQALQESEKEIQWQTLRCQSQKTAGLERMSRAIAHNSNNQLTVVMGNLELAMRELPELHVATCCLVEAIDATQRAATMGGLLMTYLGGDVMRFERQNLLEICRRSVTELSAGLPRDVSLKIESHPVKACYAKCDPQHITRTIKNLIINAIESLNKKPGKILMRLSVTPPAEIPSQNRFPVGFQPQAGEYICLEVNDTGCGIEEETIEKIFDPFYTTKFIGRGLGLSAVLGVMKSHRGCITVKSRPGQSSDFRIYLPKAD